MAGVTGPKPKEPSAKVSRTPNAHDWTDVADVPYAGEVPSIGRVPAATKRWWAVVSSMPHCVLWDPGDWQFAIDTARIHAAFSKGDMARAQELRVRERAMGTTLDARRDLRIRYVKLSEESPEEPIDPSLTDFEAERRARLLGAG